ncbi:MAG TPA: ABC transporter permease subunit [Patescibacteria group bacterium]|nr:ABC transporter permease subunit [Patescibacteria group bacterium]
MPRNLNRFKIYKNRAHVAATIAIVALPFLFLLLFSQVAKIASSELFYDVFISVFRLAIAYAVAAATGWLLAVWFYHGQRSHIALPLFDVLQSFPTFAAVPLATLYWGATDFTVIFFLAVTIIWPICFNVISSLRSARRDWTEAVEMSRLTGWNYLRYYLWPVTVPGFVTGSIISLGEGWEALVATEIIIQVKPGLGNFFQAYSVHPGIIFFGILALLLIVFSLNKIIWSPLLEKSHLMTEE